MTSENVQASSGASPYEDVKGELIANVYQIAILNNLLPRGFRFESYENVRKSDIREPATGKRQKTVALIITKSNIGFKEK